MDERRSRCTYPRAEPMQWRDFIDSSASDVTEFNNWFSAQLPMNQTWIAGRIDTLMQAAAKGEIVHDPNADNDPNAKVVPLRADPDIYELRWKLLTTMVRHYHAEPAELEDELVALHVHIKTDKAHQDKSVAEAVNRYEDGKDTLWT